MDQDRIRKLVHLYEDGALNRRDLVKRLTGVTGSAAAALGILEATGLAQTLPAICPDGARVVEDDPAVVSQIVTMHGEGGPLFG